MIRLPGELSIRFADRQNLAWKFQLPPRSTRDEASVVRKRIDALCTKIGKQAVTQPLPEAVAANQRAVKEAAAELKGARERLTAAESQLQRAQGQSEAIRAKAAISKAKTEAEQLQTQAEFVLLVLGRSCVERDVELPDCASDIQKVKDLKMRLAR